MSGNPPIVETNNLSKRYLRAQALDGVNLKIERGVILGLLGPNGSGKSTLLKIIAGLAQPTGGGVLVDGRRPSVRTKADIAYLPEIDNLYGWMTVRETIGFISAFYPDWQEDRAAELMKAMDLDPDQKVRNLSKGMRARLKLVLALSRDVPLVLLDEPLSGIDPPSRARIIGSIVNEYRIGEQTIIMSTHQVGEAESVFDSVVFLREGTVALHDSAENLRSRYGSSIQDMWEKVYE